MKTINSNLLSVILIMALIAVNLSAESGTEKLVKKVTQSIVKEDSKKEDFKENILKKIDEKISQSNSPRPISASPIEIEEKTYQEKRKTYPVMIGSYRITKKGKTLYESATVVDNDDNVYILTTANNKIVKKIEKDYIDYKEKDSSFRSTLVHHNLTNDKTLKPTSLNLLNPIAIKKRTIKPAKKIPTFEQVVSDFNK